MEEYSEFSASVKELKFETLDEIYQFFSQLTGRKLTEEKLLEFIRIKNENGKTFLHLAVERAKSEEILKFIWLEIENSLTDDADLIEILTLQDGDGKTPLLACIESKNENSFPYLFKNIYCGIFDFEEIFDQTDDNDENFLHYLFRYGTDSFIKNTFEKIENQISGHELKKFLKDSVNYEQSSIISLAISNAPLESLKLALSFFTKIYSHDEFKDCLKNTKEHQMRNLLTQCISKNQNFKSVKFFWEYLEEKLNYDEFLKILEEKDYSNSNLFHIASIYLESFEMFDFVYEKIQNFFNDEEKFKKYLMMRGYRESGIIDMTLPWKNEKTFKYLIDKIFDIFQAEQILNLFDSKNENLIHYLCRYGNESMLTLGFEKLEKKLQIQDLKRHLDLKTLKGYNMLHLALVSHQQEESLTFMMKYLDKLYGEGETKRKLMELNADNVLPLHKAIEGSERNIFEFIFKIYEDNFTKSEIVDFLNMKASPYNTKLNKSLIDFTRDHASDSETIETVQKVLTKYELI